MKPAVRRIGLGTLLRDERAATAVEYGLILSLICLAALVAITNLGGATTAKWTMIANKVAGQ